MRDKIVLLGRMVRLYGFENPIVIQFAKMIEDDKYSYEMLKVLVEAHEQYPQYEGEDE